MGRDALTEEEVKSMAKRAHNYWRLHFFVCVAVIGAGIVFNGGRYALGLVSCGAISPCTVVRALLRLTEKWCRPGLH